MGWRTFLRRVMWQALVGYGAALMVVNANAGPARAEPLRLMVLGDSLTAGFGLPAGQGFTVQLEQALRAEGYQVSVLNAGVSGDTTAGGLARLDWALGDRPGAAIVELGANDALRGLDPAAAYRNLDAILGRLKQQGVPVLLAGMYAPPNYGRDYAETFAAIYPRLAKVHGVPLYPFFLEGVAGQARLNQPDGLHPNAEGVKLMVQGILPMVRRLLDGAGGKG
ncbi:Esterase TesA [Magnetospirillum sp. UT-4]|nr:Esterase TesA [Magnetospirillum sp. UT-4]